MNCHKVIYSKNGKKLGSETFELYDNALTQALIYSEQNGYLCVVITFNPKKGNWVKRCTVYPNE